MGSSNARCAADSRGGRRGAARYLAIDEHSYLKHFELVTMVVNRETQTVLHVADDRTAEGLAGYFDGLSIDDRLAIEAIAMDMWARIGRRYATPCPTVM